MYELARRGARYAGLWPLAGEDREARGSGFVERGGFLLDEETAVAAGYRPCAICMPEEYRLWKER